MALVHRHLAGGAPSGRPADGKGRGLHQAEGPGCKAEGGDYGAKTRSERGGWPSEPSDGGPGGIRGETPRPTGKEAGPGS